MTTATLDATATHAPTGRLEQVATRAVFLAAGFAMAAWAPLVPYAKARLGVEDGTLGLLLLCFGLGSIVAMPLTGVLANRFGCRLLIATAAVVVVLVMPMLVLADTVPTLALALAVFGAGIGTIDVAMNIQAVMVEKDSGRSMMSGFHGLFSLGGIVGAGAVSLMVGAGLPLMWTTLVVAAALAAMVAFGFGGLLTYGNREAAGSPLFVVPRGIVVFIGVLCFLVFLSEGSVLDWSAVFLISRLKVEAGVAGLGYTMFAIAMTVGRLFGDRIVTALGGTRVLIVSGIVGALGFALAVFAPTAIVASVGFLLVGFGASNIVPVLFTAAGRQRRMPASLAIASITTLGYAGVLAGPAAIGFIAQSAGLGNALLLLAVGLLIVAVAGPAVLRRAAE